MHAQVNAGILVKIKNAHALLVNAIYISWDFWYGQQLIKMIGFPSFS